jgi:phosphate transport system permease protein
MIGKTIAARQFRQRVAFGICRLATVLVLAALGGILLYVVVKGAGGLTYKFLVSPPDQGGIFPAIVGTLLLTLMSILVALPLGVAAAVYLSEYAREGRLLRIIRLGINNLAGVPSVIFGLFGLALFCVLFGFGKSLLAGGLTLGLLILPTIIGASEEALRQVPSTFREASLALGATRWQTIRRVVLPAALPGILTGSILGIGRAAGETAPIMFTAAAFTVTHLPRSPLDEVMALPSYVYILANEGRNMVSEGQSLDHVQYGTILVLILLVLGMSLGAIIIRSRMRRKKKW